MKKRKKGSGLVLSLQTGLFAGLVWGAVRWLATGLNFTGVSQAFLVDPFVRRANLGGIGWQLLGYALFIAMSVAAAAVYWALLRKLQGPWPGLLFGAGWWLGGYVGLGPPLGAVPPLRQIGWTSLTTDFCLFLVWGLFIGYTIAFSLHDEFRREPGVRKSGSPPSPGDGAKTQRKPPKRPQPEQAH